MLATKYFLILNVEPITNLLATNYFQILFVVLISGLGRCGQPNILLIFRVYRDPNGSW